ncbi:hypothetical protein [Ruegeria atlantica]|uniref:Transposase n=1 Tax=Ruegeria atlantica TaxID=81569 RepID=A0ABX1WG40_9RHOB|nr:hypothetical protein [Ruegeria atlantica]NOD32177.1 hypothetical protein [Ruegeria atlantica]
MHPGSEISVSCRQIRLVASFVAHVRIWADPALHHLKGHTQSDLSVRTVVMLAATGWRGSADLLA